MKTRTFSKKLMLNKTTVAHLSDDSLKHVHGGYYKTEAPTACIPRSCSPLSCQFCTEMCITLDETCMTPIC
jgi:hypothetical protein